MPPWILIPFDEQYIDPVVSIENASFKNPWQKKAFLNELRCAGSMTFVTKRSSQQDDPVIAYVCLRQIESAMHLLKVAVAPDWRRRGIATWLMTSCFKKITESGLRAVHLEVRPGNTAAQALYKKLGFKLIGIRPKYYTDTGEDALVLVKLLKEA